ncbi:alpha-1-3-glucanase/mutanase [Penicillium atrosanguineum]|nr:alpha-1-3-glucanase/mutanase [Penicillium atrosanguineum]
MPGYDKDWLWRGDDLLPNQAASSELADSAYTAFSTGRAPYNYVLGMPHDGWRAFLPWLIETYKSNSSTIEQEGVQGWYQLNAAGNCVHNGGTTGNTANQLELECYPYQNPHDSIFFSSLLGSSADISVTIGGSMTGT